MSRLETYHYTQVPPERVSDELNAVFAALQREDPQLARSANANAIVMLDGPERIPEFDEWIQAISQVHPSRCFAIVPDDSAGEIRTEISAKCHVLTKTQHACSEVVRISAPRKLMRSVPSVVRGHLLTGVGTEVFVRFSTIARSALDTLESVCDVIYYDSGQLPHAQEVLSRLEEMRVGLVDLQWVGIAAWRDEIKRVFDNRAIRSALERAVEVRVTGAPENGFPAAPYLFLGWLVDRLALRVDESSDGEILCRGDGRHGVHALTVKVTSAGAPGLNEVMFRFAAPNNGDLRSIVLRHLGEGTDAQLETVVDFGEQFRSVRPIEAEHSPLAQLKRFFLIGESTLNYRGALVQALELARLSGVH